MSFRCLASAFVAAFLGAACSSVSPPSAQDDWQAFLERRDLCDHLRGEIPDPEDPQAVRESVAAVNQYCAGTDAQLRQLKRRHSADAGIMARLNALEPCIERASDCRSASPPP